MTYVDFILLMVAALLLIWFIMPSSNQPDLAEKVRSGLHLTPLEVNLLARYKTLPQPLPQAGIYRAAYPTTMVKQGMTFVLQHEFEIHPDKATWRRKIWGHFTDKSGAKTEIAYEIEGTLLHEGSVLTLVPDEQIADHRLLANSSPLIYEIHEQDETLWVLEPWSEKMEKMTGIKAFDGAVRQWYKKWMGINHD